MGTARHGQGGIRTHTPIYAKNRQVLIGWIAGMCDGENCGRLLAYQFPKEKCLPMTQQVEAKIDQDSFLSGQLTLWDQRVSQVIRGNVLVLPIEYTLLYVEPIYLMAETAAYPELRTVVLMHDDNLSYGDTFDEALERPLKGGDEAFREKKETLFTVKEVTGYLIKQVSEAFDNYLSDMGKKDFDSAPGELKRMRENTGQTHGEKILSCLFPVFRAAIVIMEPCFIFTVYGF